MGFEGFQNYDFWKANAPVEYEAPEAAEEPLYRLMFSYRGGGISDCGMYTLPSFVRVRFERDKRLVCSGSGDDEASAVRALRENLRDYRAHVRGWRARGERVVPWRYEHEHEGLGRAARAL